MKTVAALLSLLLLSGCLGGDDDPVDAAATTADEAAPVDPSASASAPSASAGSSSSSGASPPAASTAEATPEAALPPSPVEVPYEWTGKVPREACLGATAVGCFGAIATQGWWDKPTFEAPATHATLTLTWTPEPGGIEELRFVLLRAKDTDSGWTGEPIGEITGVSPLALDVDVPPIPAGEYLIVAARSASIVPEPGFAFAHTDQGFVVDGTFTVQP